MPRQVTVSVWSLCTHTVPGWVLKVMLLQKVLQWPCTSIALSGWLFAASVQLLPGHSDLLMVGSVSELAMLDPNSTCAAIA